MGLVDTLRRAEEQARKAARAGMQRTIVGLDDAERAIRRRMRIYPKQMTAIRAANCGQDDRLERTTGRLSAGIRTGTKDFIQSQLRKRNR